MQLSDQTIHHVTASLARLYPRKAVMARKFYRNVFEDRPEMRALFPEDMTAQHVKLSETLALVVRHLARPDAMAEQFERLATLHRRHGVTRAHLELVRPPLLAALAEETPGGLSQEELAAWGHAYDLVAAELGRRLDP